MQSRTNHSGQARTSLSGCELAVPFEVALADRQMYDEAMDGIKKHLVGRTKKSNLMFTQELHPAKHPETGEQYVQRVSLK